MFQQLLFLTVFGLASLTAFLGFRRIWENVNLGKPDTISGDASLRWKNVFLIAFGQKKMFERIIPAVLHLFIYVAFIFTQIELIEIVIDGVFGTHRFFMPYLGSLYTVIISFIEILSVLAFVATIAFLARRNIIKLARFQKPELKGWPTNDANIILILEIILIFAIFSMNGADKVLQTKIPDVYHHSGNFAISSWLGPMLFGNFNIPLLLIVERLGWWIHLAMVLGFLNYLPYSKHLHIILAFPNTYFAKLNAKGEMSNMPDVMNEVKNMMGIGEPSPTDNFSSEMPAFGANDVTSLSWKNVLDAYTCTECGRCTSVCPANLTGKKLSPRKVMMDVRDRAQEIGEKISSGETKYLAKNTSSKLLDKTNFDDGKSLFDFISKEELHACTTCNACVEACPVLINPLDIILQLRRYEILTLSEGPQEWVPMFTAIENGGSVWQVPDPREKWATDLMNEA